MKQAAAWINHRLYHWNSSCLLLVQSSKWKVICKGQELLVSGWSLPGDVGWGRAGEAQLRFEWVQYLHRELQWLTCIGYLNHSAQESMHRGSTSDKALCSHWRGQKLLQESLLGLLPLDLSLVSCCHEKDRFHLS